MKKLLSLVLVLVLTLTMVGCGSNKTAEITEGGAKSDVKIGVILIGDDTENYTKAHIDGIKAAQAALSIPDENVVWKYSVPETDECSKTAEELVAQGCNLIISNSYGHQDFITLVAQQNPDVDFVAMTGDYAAISGVENLSNAFTCVYESRFVSGVVAGMKIAELVKEDKIPDAGYNEDGKVKVGYVGAFPYAEVVSGYTAFFLGIQHVYPDVVMEVNYTNSWFDIEAEAAAAEALMKTGCVMIGQHADSTGAPSAVQKAQDNGTVAYSVGYNVDMLGAAKTAALTSAGNNWSVYYTELFTAVTEGKEIPKNWAKGYAEDAVLITALGESVAEGTAEKVAEVEAAIKDGSLHVFDTSKFTVEGKEVTTAEVDLSYLDFSTDPATVVYQGDVVEAIKTDDNGVSYFSESEFRSAPYFSLRIDGITEK